MAMAMAMCAKIGKFWKNYLSMPLLRLVMNFELRRLIDPKKWGSQSGKG
ncbi:hypothetical protein RF679_01270 [Undibacterium cyanobacteriorum]|uniref:Uncharacterized protein n=1 Tax=Undibacterium cyanobacteriorum TaxID=3073561 RepID=A0ABY9RJ23_9BURK|nr:hypothetical protein [Undibacterium sp. 20NA77.5]WMW80926.1 hypothetical protein RF679_01270 [Undibacterium sp. 20NA77.5]